MDQQKKNSAQTMTRHDAPIGIIEGFYGKHWPQQTRLALAPTFAATGVTFYIYAPKSDAWLRKAWHEPIPEFRLQELIQLSSTYQQHSIEFGIGLSPKDIWLDWGPATRRTLAQKIRALETTNPSKLCILLDDMHGKTNGLAIMQGEIMDFVASTTQIPKLSFCPTYYSSDPILDSLFGDRPKAYLQTLGENIHKTIDIFWTGPKVISHTIPDSHLDEIAVQIGRKPLLWDNAFANDGNNSSNYLFASPPQGYVPATLKKLSGLAFNPMNQPWLSKLCIQNVLNTYTTGPLDGIGNLSRTQDINLPAGLQALIKSNVDALQKVGLKNLTPQKIRSLQAEFSKFSNLPETQEIIAWLNAEYRFDPECLTD